VKKFIAGCERHDGIYEGLNPHHDYSKNLTTTLLQISRKFVNNFFSTEQFKDRQTKKYTKKKYDLLDSMSSIIANEKRNEHVPHIFCMVASTPSRDWGFQAPEIVGGQGRRGSHV